jgi:hypothetical protein
MRFRIDVLGPPFLAGLGSASYGTLGCCTASHLKTGLGET